MNQDELWIGLVALVAWALGTAALVLGADRTPYRHLASETHATFSKEGMVLDEQLLTEVALWWWVVFVLWATQHGFR